MPTLNKNPNYDGHIIYEAVGTGSVPAWTRVTNWPVVGVTGNIVIGGGQAYRAFFDFDNSLLPAGAVITNVTLWLYTLAWSFSSVSNNFNIKGLSFTAQSVVDDETLFDDLITGNSYATNANFDGYGWHSIDLGANAVTDFNSQGFLTLALAMADENAGDGTFGGHYIKYASMETDQVPPEDYYPYIVITYTVGNTYQGVQSQQGVSTITW